MRRRFAWIIALSLAVVACSGAELDISGIDDLPEITVEDFAAHLESANRPTVVNVWASWCLPCRSEAPLLTAAHAEYGDRIDFVGVDVLDSQVGAKEFIAEFQLEFPSYFDRNRAIPNHYGGIGTPITMFFAPDGELVSVHNGVIDDRALALGIDELLRMES